jgi:hypothetical protein
MHRARERLVRLARAKGIKLVASRIFRSSCDGFGFG